MQVPSRKPIRVKCTLAFDDGFDHRSEVTEEQSWSHGDSDENSVAAGFGLRIAAAIERMPPNCTPDVQIEALSAVILGSVLVDRDRFSYFNIVRGLRRFSDVDRADIADSIELLLHVLRRLPASADRNASLDDYPPDTLSCVREFVDSRCVVNTGLDDSIDLLLDEYGRWSIEFGVESSLPEATFEETLKRLGFSFANRRCGGLQSVRSYCRAEDNAQSNPTNQPAAGEPVA